MNRIAILLPETEHSLSTISSLEPDVNPLPFLKDVNADKIRIKKNTSENYIPKIMSKYDVFLNLCDGSKDDDRAGIEVVKTLEKYNLPFTGANSAFYDPTRLEMKCAAQQNNIMVPKFLLVTTMEEMNNFNLMFPCIVKHPQSYSSIGLTKQSVVYNFEDLSLIVKQTIQKFKGALIEEFIDGREFTVLVVSMDNARVYAFDAAEIIFPDGENFKHFDLKWNKHKTMKYVKVHERELNRQLKEISIKIYKQLKGNGYARFDYRMDNHGVIYFLELNPNCSVYYPTDNASSADEILNFYDDGHELFTQYILHFAMQRFS
ncbi:MAG: ATP-grasp domain-containing protein [Bacteroidales bacterium]|nr:ATP-grasp domain-containing protein [Bacteroidales bacterium]